VKKGDKGCDNGYKKKEGIYNIEGIEEVTDC
jgi:hypothetical protein